jgi:hypothetical protein
MSYDLQFDLLCVAYVLTFIGLVWCIIKHRDKWL